MHSINWNGKSILIWLMVIVLTAYNPILSMYYQSARADVTDSNRLTYQYDGFSNDTFDEWFAADGDAEVPVGTNFLRLTSNATERSGAVFHKKTLYPTNNYSFSTAFSFQMSGSPVDGPSDGMTFTIQTGTSSEGSVGGGLGYYGIEPSFAVKYDTFYNDVYGDPSANYIGIASNGQVNNETGKYTDLDQFNSVNGTSYVLSNGTQYYTWIDYDGLNQNIQIRLSTSPDRASSHLILDVNEIDLGEIFNGDPIHTGFTASTGYPNSENHDVYSWYYVNNYSPIETLDPSHDYVINEPPTAPNYTRATTVNTSVSGQVIGTDPEDDSLAYEIEEHPANGTVAMNSDGTWTYTPNSDYVGSDTFTVLVNDGYGGWAISTITVQIKPYSPSVQSNKTVTIHQKASGNTDADRPEVGDTLLYTIQAWNTVEDSVIQNLRISDIIPEGLTYYPGTLTVDGQAVTDDADDDSGYYDNGLVVGHFGDITDTELHTLTFQATVNVDQAGQTISNTAVVEADNIGDPDEPSTEIDINPSDYVLCPAPVALINGSFEEGAERGGYDGTGLYFFESEMPGWLTTDDARGVKLIEVWNYTLGIPASATNFAPPVDGDRWAELNAYENGMLYQDVETTPGQTIYWRLSHMGRQGVDTMRVRIGPTTDDPYDTIEQSRMSTSNTAWATYTGSYTVPAGQTSTRFGFEAISTGGGSIGAGNFLDDIFLGTEPCVVVEKTVSPERAVYAGQEFTYEVNITNQGGDIAADAVFEDMIPEGTEYVPGSLSIVTGTDSTALTDENDGDAGHYDGEKVVVALGNLPNIDESPDGVTIQFKVTALTVDEDRIVSNMANVSYNNLLIDSREEVQSNEVSSTVMPLEDLNPCLAPVALINGSFEEPMYSAEDPNHVRYDHYPWFEVDEQYVPGWQTTDSTGLFEFMNQSLAEDARASYPPDHVQLNWAFDPADGQQFVELRC